VSAFLVGLVKNTAIAGILFMFGNFKKGILYEEHIHIGVFLKATAFLIKVFQSIQYSTEL